MLLFTSLFQRVQAAGGGGGPAPGPEGNLTTDDGADELTTDDGLDVLTSDNP